MTAARARNDIAGNSDIQMAKDEEWPGMARRLGSGIAAILPPNASPREITSAIEAAGNGLVVLHPDVLTALELTETRPRTREEGNSGLMPREIEVLVMLAAFLPTAGKPIPRTEHATVSVAASSPAASASCGLLESRALSRRETGSVSLSLRCNSRSPATSPDEPNL